jgi:predicted rRNA methylase YqxC with S4 and FtsJ domains
LSELDTTLVPDLIEAVTLDLSYLSLAGGVRYLSRVQLAEGAALLALVKPMFELSLAAPPVDDTQLERARRLAGQGIAEAGWVVEGSIRSPVKGARGAIEFWVHARRGT